MDMINGRDGFGISPSKGGSPIKTMAKHQGMHLVNQNLSPERQAVHKQIGGRIIQENELKLARTLDENAILQKQLDKKNQERERV